MEGIMTDQWTDEEWDNLCLAAPDMLAACKLFTAGAHDAVQALNAAGIACPASIALAAEKARAAIAKATGTDK
jgi:hypothetical protein